MGKQGVDVFGCLGINCVMGVYVWVYVVHHALCACGA